MIIKPKIPLETSAKELINFCITFRSVDGFIAMFEQTWQDEFSGKEQFKGAAYEKTETLYNHLFGARRYNDREVFYSARCRFYAKQK